MRKQTEIVIDGPDAGRDKGRKFLLTEMPASAAEKWAVRAFLALGRSGIEIPDEVRAGGMAAFAAIGFQLLGRVDFAEAEWLMDELMKCVQIVLPPEHGNTPVTRRLIEDDIDEVRTRVRLKMEVFTLHTGFSLAAVLSPLTTAGSMTSADLPRQ